MSGKFLAHASTLSLALMLAACGGGGDDSTSLSGSDGGSDSGSSGNGGGNDTATTSLALGYGSESSFQAGQIGTTTTNLAAGGESVLTVSAVNEANGNKLIAGEEISISFSSPCISSGESTINTPVTSSAGVVEARYQAAGCSGQDLVTATASSGETAQVVLDIAPATAHQISSNPPEPTSIAPTGNSNSARPSVSLVTFNVVDSNGSPVRGAEVSFRLSYSAAATSSAEDATLNPLSAKSGPGGEVVTRVTAGAQNTVVRVIASIVRDDGSTADTTSPPIAINSFVPDQDSFSMSLDKYMPNAQYHNNEVVNVTINAGDRFNNVVRGNTVVSFVTSGGAIVGDCILNELGVCTVQWQSSDPRPASGRASILARTVGDESFNDLNSNDEFEDGEFISAPPITLENGEPYLDKNTNLTYDQGQDQYFDYNANGSYDGPNGVYEGSGCLSPESQNCNNGPVAIWTSKRIVMASDAGIDIILAPSAEPNEYCATVDAETAGGQRVPVPTDTTIAFSIDDGEITSTTSSFDVTEGYVEDSSVTYCVEAEQDDDAATTTILRVTVTPPSPFSGAPAEASLAL